jgi:hypothetical protein
MPQVLMRYRQLPTAVLFVVVSCAPQPPTRPAPSAVLTSRADSAARRFPIRPESLDGRRVLLIVIPTSDVHTAYFLAGTAEWDEAELRVRSAPGNAPVVVHGSRQALEGFDPGVLPRLIVPDRYPQVAVLAQAADAVVAVFAPTAPAGAVALKAPFYGLASGPGNEVLLMQGDPGAH